MMRANNEYSMATWSLRIGAPDKPKNRLTFFKAISLQVMDSIDYRNEKCARLNGVILDAINQSIILIRAFSHLLILNFRNHSN